MPLKQVNKRIEELCKQWLSLQPLNQEDDERLWKKIRLEWNYNSNRIEGNTLTYGETELLLIHGRVEGDHSMRDYEEMKAHDLAIKKVREFAEDKKRHLNEADIRDLNLLILKEPFWKKAETPEGHPTRKEIFPGKYKTQPNHVRTATGEIFKFAIPEEVPVKMQELIKWLKGNIESSPAPIALFLAQLHHRFIIIHPFDDGNGRIVRLLLNYVLMRFGYPPLVIKNSDRNAYFSALQKADAGNIDALAVYLGETLASWLEIGIRAAEGEDISEPEDIDKEVDIFIRKKKAEGLTKIKALSKQVKIELCKELLIPLFETFRDRFEQFDDLFHSNYISLSGPEEILDCFTEDSQTNRTITDLRIVSLVISYNAYKCKEPFDMRVRLSAQLSQFEYTVMMQIYADSSLGPKLIKRDRVYSHIWTDSEIKEFVAEGKELFFEDLRQKA